MDVIKMLRFDPNMTSFQQQKNMITTLLSYIIGSYCVCVTVYVKRKSTSRK